jgi:hypothetical protein
MKTIFFGPWIGEFGFEVQNLIGQCLRIRNMFPDHRAVVSSFWGRRDLYPWANEFLSHTLESNYTIYEADRCTSKGVMVNPEVEGYLKDALVFRPGVSLPNVPSGLISGRCTLGEGCTYPVLKDFLECQTHEPLLASDENKGLVHIYAGDKKIVCLMARADMNSYGWPESRWIELTNKLISQGYFVVGLAPHCTLTKACYLNGYSAEGFIDLGREFKDHEDFCGIQIAFLRESQCCVSLTSGIHALSYKTKTPCVHMLPREDDREDLIMVPKLLADRYGSALRLLFGRGSVMDITTDDCFNAMKEFL